MFREFLERKKSAIVNNWTRLTIDTYSSRTSEFLRLEKDQFSNPVGYIIKENTAKIFDELTGKRNIVTLKVLLADIIKIRAIQEFTPSQAVSFVFQLKKAIHNEMKNEKLELTSDEELMNLFSAIDELALIAFDLYAEFREKVYKIRVNEIKTHSQQILSD